MTTFTEKTRNETCTEQEARVHEATIYVREEVREKRERETRKPKGTAVPLVNFQKNNCLHCEASISDGQ